MIKSLIYWESETDRCFINDFPLPLPPPLTKTAPIAVALGNSWLLLHLISSSTLVSFFHVISFLKSLFFGNAYCLLPPLLSLGHIHPLDCCDCSAFLCHGLQEEWVSTCQRAQVCAADTGWLIYRLLEWSEGMFACKQDMATRHMMRTQLNNFFKSPRNLPDSQCIGISVANAHTEKYCCISGFYIYIEREI